MINGQRDNVTQFYTDLQAVLNWKYIDNLSQGGINDNISQDAVTPSVVTDSQQLYAAWIENNKIRVKVYNHSSGWSYKDTNAKTGSSGTIYKDNTATIYNPSLVYEATFSA